MRTKRFTSAFGNQKGFTVVEAIMAGGLGVLLIGGFMGGMAAMSSVQRSVDVAGDAKSLSIQLAENLKSGDTCQTAMVDKAMNISSATPVDISMMTRIGDAEQEIKEGASPMPGVRVKKFQLVTNMSVTPIEIPTADAGVTVWERIAVLRLEIEKEVNGVSQLMKPTDIPMKLLTDASGVVKFCSTGVNPALVCAQQGGTFDTATSICKPANHCEFGGSYGDSINDGRGNLVGGYANEITGARSCANGFTAVRSGSSTVARACGKTCIENAYAATYSCVRCGDTMAIFPPVSTTGVAPSDLNNNINSEIATNEQLRDEVAALPPPVVVAGPSGGAGSGAGSGSGGGSGGGGSDTGVGSGCFVGGTRVLMADGSKKSIEDVQVGERIVSFNEETNQPFHSTVTETFHHPQAAQRIYDIYLNDGHQISANGIHPIFVVEAGRYLQVKDIYKLFVNKKTTSLVTATSAKQRIAAVRVRDVSVPVYNLHVDGVTELIGHNYFAEGVLAHNVKGIGDGTGISRETY